MNGLYNPFFFLSSIPNICSMRPGIRRRVLSPPGRRPFALCSRALGAGAVGHAKELRLWELRSRTFVKRSWELGRTMLMGAGSYALYHARVKMSIGAAKKFFYFFIYIPM
jgi:hypothetical protein